MPDMAVRVGSIELPHPVLLASGCAGHGAELDSYFPLSEIGAVTVKSLAIFEHPGNPAPRMHSTSAGMINSVGLQGRGIAEWLENELPSLIECGARVVASVWGRTIDDYRRAAAALAPAPPEVIAVEFNLSCPNTEAGRDLFAHMPEVSAEIISTVDPGRPRWAKLSPNTSRLVEVAEAVTAAGAESLTLINTVMGMAIDPKTRRYRLGSGVRGGGLSGPAIRPAAVRAIHDVRKALPEMSIVGVGGVTDAASAVELMLAGADAIAVGTATFADPKAAHRVARDLKQWCADERIDRVAQLTGAINEY